MEYTTFFDPSVEPDGSRIKLEKLSLEGLQRIIETLPTLPPEDIEYLEKSSAITPEVIKERGYRRISDVSVLKQLGFSERHGPGVLIPIRDEKGSITSCQVRFDNPVTTTDPKTGKRRKLRYMSPPGIDCRIDFSLGPPPGLEIEAWILEGAKKTDALRSRGVYAVGLSGVWNWSGRSARKDFERIDWKNRTAIVCFDSDVTRNESVTKARRALTDFLRELGAEVRWVTPPAQLGGEKTGIDDFLADGGQLEDLPHESPEPEWIGQLVRSETTGMLKINSANLTLILENDERFRDAGDFSYDEFSNILLIGKNPITDPLITEIGAQIELAWNLGAIPPSMLRDVLLMIGKRRTFHPVRDWLNSLKWDGTARVDTMLEKYFGAKDSAYTRATSRNLMIGAVARIMEPGSKVDLVPILMGPQGIGKSMGISALFGEEWTDVPNASWDSKDFLQKLHSGIWAMELAELAGMRRSDVEQVKKMITSQSDRFRSPYGRIQENFPRQCVFIGTTNAQEFLKDPTGNRRFLPVRVKNISLESLRRDRSQIWAEAIHRFKNGENWWEIPWEEAESEREAVFESDSWEEEVIPWLSVRSPQQVTISDVLKDCLDIPLDRHDRSSQSRVGAILHRLGWYPKRVRSGGGRLRVYEPGTLTEPGPTSEVGPRCPTLDQANTRATRSNWSNLNGVQNTVHEENRDEDIDDTHVIHRSFQKSVGPVGPVDPNQCQSHSQRVNPPGQPQRLDHPDANLPVLDFEP